MALAKSNPEYEFLHSGQMCDIRRLYAGGHSIKELANKYGVSRKTISNVLAGPAKCGGVSR